jgi:uncharacterized damage-inducible protein DinB
MNQSIVNRRKFLHTTTLAAIGTSSLGFLPFESFGNPGSDDNINIIGPLEGYSPQVGILVSMMNWMRSTVIRSAQGLSQTELDYLPDENANTIGALLLHLAATDVVYQDLTFNNLKTFSEENKKKWGVAMSLGAEGRKQIKGNNLDYYLNALKEVREKTLQEFKKRDDKWLFSVDEKWFWGPTNNYCKWFHVCEHESNHNGQIKYIKSRLPGAKKSND